MDSSCEDTLQNHANDSISESEIKPSWEPNHAPLERFNIEAESVMSSIYIVLRHHLVSYFIFLAFPFSINFSRYGCQWTFYSVLCRYNKILVRQSHKVPFAK